MLRNLGKVFFRNLTQKKVQTKCFGSVHIDPSTETDNETNSNANNMENNQHPFTKEFQENRIHLSEFQRMILSAGSSIAALLDPKRHDMIACLGETTGESALQNILDVMRSCAESRRILEQKPRINTKTVNVTNLANLPVNTFGFAYVKFLKDNNVTPDSRMEVRFMDDAELAYIMTRYRESHDLYHTVLGMPTNMLGEVTVKWVEALNIGLPMCYGGAVFGAARLRPKQRKAYINKYLPWALKTGKRVRPLMNIFWEERWEQDLSQLRNELGISPLA